MNIDYSTDQTRFVRTKEASEILGIAEGTLRSGRSRRDPRFPKAYRVLSSVVYDRDELIAYVKSRPIGRRPA